MGRASVGDANSAPKSSERMKILLSIISIKFSSPPAASLPRLLVAAIRRRSWFDFRQIRVIEMVPLCAEREHVTRDV